MTRGPTEIQAAAQRLSAAVHTVVVGQDAAVELLLESLPTPVEVEPAR